MLPAKRIDTFWSYVDRAGPDECWNWTGATVGDKGFPYGKFRVDGRDKSTHRIAYEISVGPIPVGHVVRHKCDNPRCVNPGHLLTGTQMDNVRDMIERGRASKPPITILRGKDNGTTKLTDEQVLEIRRSPDSSYAIAPRYGVSASHVRAIRSGKFRSSVASPGDGQAESPVSAAGRTSPLLPAPICPDAPSASLGGADLAAGGL